MDTVPPRRGADPEDEDYRPVRQPITGEEVRIGIGKWSLGIRGANIAALVVSLMSLAIIGWHVNEQTRTWTLWQTAVTQEHSKMLTGIERSMRIQTCVLSMTAEERMQWRASRDAQNALMAFCPSLLLPAVGP